MLTLKLNHKQLNSLLKFLSRENFENQQNAQYLRTTLYLQTWFSQLNDNLENQENIEDNQKIDTTTIVSVEVKSSVYSFLKRYILKGDFPISNEETIEYDEICSLFEREG